MVQPPIIGGDRGVWGQKLLDWIQDITGDAVSQATVDALAAQVSGNIAAIDAVNDRVDRVDPGTAGTDNQELRVADGGVIHFRDPDSVSPLDNGAVGDGTTNDYAAIMGLIDKLPDRGGPRLDLGGKSYKLNTALTLDKPLHIDGGTGAEWDGAGGNGATLIFASGLAGIVGATGSAKRLLQLSNLTVQSLSNKSGSGHGITIQSSGCSLEHVTVTGFGDDGVCTLSDPDLTGANANFLTAVGLEVSDNGGNGLSLHGQDSNCGDIVVDATNNDGYGVWKEESFGGRFFVHAAYNDLGAVFDGGNGSDWLMYVEHVGADSQKFIVGSGSQYGRIRAIGTAIPTVERQGGGYPALENNWDIKLLNKQWNRMSLKSATSSLDWMISAGVAGGDLLTFHTDDGQVMALGGSAGDPRVEFGGRVAIAEAKNIHLGTTTGSMLATAADQKLGFWGKTPVVQPVASADTSGASLTDLETEVNQLKALLRSVGLMAT